MIEILNVFQGLWKKFSPKETVKNYTENDLVCDSVPDDDYKYKSAENSGQQFEQMKNMCNDDSTSKNEQSSYDSEEEIIKDEDFSEKREEEKRQETRRSEAKNKNKSRDAPKQITNNVSVINGSVHIGNETTQIYNIQQNYNAGGPKKEKKGKKQIPLTQEIKDILYSSIKLGRDHMTFLQKHFGKSARDIGLVLGLSNGQLDEIEKECGKDTKEMSFEIMNSWMRNNGDQATLGRLCLQLWNSKITRAREAVKHLSEKINDF